MVRPGPTPQSEWGSVNSQPSPRRKHPSLKSPSLVPLPSKARRDTPARARVLRAESEASFHCQTCPGAAPPLSIALEIPSWRLPFDGGALLPGAPALMELRHERALIDVVPDTALVVRVRAHTVLRRPVLRRGSGTIRPLPHRQRLPGQRHQSGSRVSGRATGRVLVRPLQGRGEDVEFASRSLVPASGSRSSRRRLAPHFTALSRGNVPCPVSPFPYATYKIAKRAIVDLSDAFLPCFLNQRELVVGQTTSVVGCALCHGVSPLKVASAFAPSDDCSPARIHSSSKTPGIGRWTAPWPRTAASMT